MTDEQPRDEQPRDEQQGGQPQDAPRAPAEKGAHPVFMIVFALFALLAIRGPDYPLMPPPGAATPPPPHAIALEPPLPGDIAAQAASALAFARQWRPDAILVGITSLHDNGYAPVYSFLSPSGNMRLNAVARPGGAGFDTTAQPAPQADAQAPNDPAPPSKPVPPGFLDLPKALAFARMQGFTGQPYRLTLRTLDGPAPGQDITVWTFQAAPGDPGRGVNAVTGMPTAPARP